MPSYTVRQGQSLAKIARSANINLLDLVAANPQIIDPDLIHAGQKIRLPGKPRSAAQRNIAAQRIASGSYSAGTFAADAEGTMMEVGQFRFGPGGGQGAAAQGYNFGEYFSQFGHLPGYLPYGQDAPTGPAGGALQTPGGGPNVEGVHGGPGGADIYRGGPGGPNLQGQAPNIEELVRGPGGIDYSQVGRNVAGPAGRGRRLGPVGQGDRAGPAAQRPDVSGALTDYEGIHPRAGIPPRAGDEAFRAPIRPTTPPTHAERTKQYYDLLAQGMEPAEAREIAYNTDRDPIDIQFTNRTGAALAQMWREYVVDPGRQIIVQNQVYSSLMDSYGREGADAILAQLDWKNLPLSITKEQIEKFMLASEAGMPPELAMRHATSTKGQKVTKDSSPQDQVDHVMAEPASRDVEDMIHITNNPITFGEKRFPYDAGYNTSPDTVRIIQENWDGNVVITAAHLASNTLRGEELERQITDASEFMYALSTNEPWARALLTKAQGNIGLTSDEMNYLNTLANMSPEELLAYEDIRIGGRDSAVQLLEDAGFEKTGGNRWDQWNSTDDEGSGSGVGALVEGSGGGFSPYGRNYRSPDYIGPKKPGGGTTPYDPGPGFRGSGSGGGTIFYQWRIGAPGV